MSVLAAPTYQFTVEEYERLGQLGFFTKEDRVELLNGSLVVMPPIGIRHAAAVRRINKLFVVRFGDFCEVDVQSPMQLDGKSEPQPDLLLLRPGITDDLVRPVPVDVLLLVEVADSTLNFDLTDKRDAYARNGIVEYWLLDLTQDQLLVFRDPAGLEYRSEAVLRGDEEVTPLCFPDTSVKVRELLP